MNNKVKLLEEELEQKDEPIRTVTQIVVNQQR